MNDVINGTIAEPNDIWCFEFRTSDPKFQYYVEVVHTHKHHFTGETMRYVRIDSINFGEAETYYDFLNEKEWNDILSKRVTK